MKKFDIIKLKLHRGIQHSKPLEDYDYVTHSVAAAGSHQCVCNDVEDGHELKENDETKTDSDKDKDYYLMDTTLIGEIMHT